MIACYSREFLRDEKSLITSCISKEGYVAHGQCIDGNLVDIMWQKIIELIEEKWNTNKEPRQILTNDITDLYLSMKACDKAFIDFVKSWHGPSDGKAEVRWKEAVKEFIQSLGRVEPILEIYAKDLVPIIKAYAYFEDVQCVAGLLPSEDSEKKKIELGLPDREPQIRLFSPEYNLASYSAHAYEYLQKVELPFSGPQFREAKAALENFIRSQFSIEEIHHAISPRDTPEGNIAMETITKILFLGANPKTTLRLRLDEEVRNIQINLKLAKERHNLSFNSEWAVTTNTLMQAVLDESPRIIHFSGHGQQEGIMLEDEIGEPKIITTEALAYLFGLFRDTVKCVILNSCYSEEQAKTIKAHIPYVITIGMQSTISDKTALAFSTGFYKAIGAGKDIPFAFKMGIAAIKLEGIPADKIPVLL